MAALNKVMVLGNVGNEPEVRQTQSGRAVVNFSVATTDAWGEGEDRQERTEWHQGGGVGEAGRDLWAVSHSRVAKSWWKAGFRRGATRIETATNGPVTEIVAQQVEFLGAGRNTARQTKPPPCPRRPRRRKGKRSISGRGRPVRPAGSSPRAGVKNGRRTRRRAVKEGYPAAFQQGFRDGLTLGLGLGGGYALIVGLAWWFPAEAWRVTAVGFSGLWLAFALTLLRRPRPH